MSIAALIREALLTRSLPATATPPTLALQQRIYSAAIAVLPVRAAMLRSVTAPRAETDEALLAAFASGDASAFEMLVQRHVGWMLAWACQHLPRPDAEDATQDAFITLVGKVAQPHLRSALRGTLFGPITPAAVW